MEIPNIHIDHKIIAKHYGKCNEAMRLSKSKWKKGENSFWETYVKAYNFDKGILNQSVLGQSNFGSIEN